MRVLAVDPGECATGWAVLEEGRVVATGTIRTKKDPAIKPLANDHARRIGQIARELLGVLREHDVKLLVAEMPNAGAKSATALAAMARVAGLTATFAELCGLPHLWVTPTQVKRATTGRRHASKQDVEAGVRARWPGHRFAETKIEREHVVDALGAYMAVELLVSRIIVEQERGAA